MFVNPHHLQHIGSSDVCIKQAHLVQSPAKHTGKIDSNRCLANATLTAEHNDAIGYGIQRSLAASMKLPKTLRIATPAGLSSSSTTLRPSIRQYGYSAIVGNVSENGQRLLQSKSLQTFG